MSKYVKELLSNDLKNRWNGVEELLVVDCVGVNANSSVKLRRQLREKGMNLLVVKNSLAARATQGTPLEIAFEGAAGSSAVVWGGEDIVSLAKEVISITEDEQYAPFEPKGGVLDGNCLTADEVKEVSKWPSRTEQLSIISGQLLASGANISGALLGVGAQLASQVKS